MRMSITHGISGVGILGVDRGRLPFSSEGTDREVYYYYAIVCAHF